MSEEDDKLKERPGQWMLKPCEWYKEEYKDCKCLRARFNQWFVHGEMANCSQWKVAYANCNRWKTKDDDEAYNALLESEQKRRLARLKPHYTNDVWTRREKPPEGWNKPLPEWMSKEYEHTYLNIKQKGLETGNINDIDMNVPFCTIL